MTAPDEKIYMRRRHRRYGYLWSALFFLIAAVLVAAIVLFYALQRYIVYDADGLHLEVPWLTGDTARADAAAPDAPAEETPPVSAPPEVTAEVVVDAADWSDYSSTAGQDLAPMRAQRVPAGSISAAGLDEYAQRAQANGCEALVLEMKSAGGQLSWASGIPLAASYGANGSFDIGSILPELHEAGLYLAAEVSCCTDELMATRNPFLALRFITGLPYQDGDGQWLDLYNPSVREYLTDLVRELYEQGFDEVILRGLSLPDTADDLLYTTDMTVAADHTGRVLKYSEALRALADEYGARLSIVYPPDTTDENTGLDVTRLTLFYDRIYYVTTTDLLNARTDTLSAAVGETWDETRFVPMLDRWTDRTSFVLCS